MKILKTLGTMALGLTMAVSLAACNGGDSNPAGSGSNELTIWTLTHDDSQDAAWNALVEGFQAANDGVTVKTETRAVDAHKDALRQASGTGTGPDIYRYWAGSGLGGELVEVGMSTDITKYYDQYKWEDKLITPATTYATQYGGHHGVALITAVEGVFYNKAIFEAAGLEIPTTYEELVAAAETLKGEGVTPMTFGGTVNWHVMRLLDSIIETKCGAEKADELNTADGDWSKEPCVAESFVEIKKWGDDYLNEGYMAISNDDASQLFYTGEAAMTIEGNWFGPMSKDNGMKIDEVGVFPFPTGTKRSYGFGEMLYVTPDADNPDLAAKFLDYMISEEGQEKLGTAFSALPINKNVALPEDAILGEEWMAMMNDSEGSFMNNDQNFSTAETTEYWRIQNSVLTGDLDPAKAGAEFQTWRTANN